MSHEVIWRGSLTEVAASRESPKNEEFHTGGCCGCCTVYKEGQRQEVRGDGKWEAQLCRALQVVVKTLGFTYEIESH